VATLGLWLKSGRAQIASAIGLGPLGGAAAVTTVMGIEAAHNNPYTSNCSGTTGGCDSGTMQD